MYIMPGTCTSELQLKVNSRPKVNCGTELVLTQSTAVGWQVKNISYNPLSAAIILYVLSCPCLGSSK